MLDHATGIVDKCRYCVAGGDETSTNCVTACPANVRIWGDLDDPDSEVAKAVAAHNAQPLAPNLSHAKFYYVR